MNKDINLEWYVLNGTHGVRNKEEFETFPYCFHETEIRPWNVFNNWPFREAAIDLAIKYLDGKLEEDDNWNWCDDYPEDLYERFKFKLKKELQHEEWSRCEYEICVTDWPTKCVDKDGNRVDEDGDTPISKVNIKMDKVDTYSQVLPNFDIFAKYVLETVEKER